MLGASLALTDSLKGLLRDTAEGLKGTERRQFMAQVVQGLGLGGQAQAERDLGWNRGTIRKGLHELAHGPIQDAFEQRGRKPTEARLPQLLEDIRASVEPYTQADPTLTSQRLYTRLSAAEVRRRRDSAKRLSRRRVVHQRSDSATVKPDGLSAQASGQSQAPEGDCRNGSDFC